MNIQLRCQTPGKLNYPFTYLVQLATVVQLSTLSNVGAESLGDRCEFNRGRVLGLDGVGCIGGGVERAISWCVAGILKPPSIHERHHFMIVVAVGFWAPSDQRKGKLR